MIKKRHIALCIIMCVFGFPSAMAEDVVEVLNIDFEDMESGDFTSQGNWTVSTIAGDSITIEDDPMGSRAVKLVRAEANVQSGGEGGIRYTLDTPITSGKIRVTYDMRLEKYRSRMKDWGTIGGQKLFTHQGIMYAHDTASGADIYTVRNLANDGKEDKYATVDRTINFDAGTFDIKIVHNGSEYGKKSNKSFKKGTASSILFTLGTNSTARLPSGSEGDAIYWIDNIKIEIFKFALQSVYPEADSTTFDVDGLPTITFNKPVSADTANSDNIFIHKGEEKIDCTIGVTNNMVTIQPAERLDYDTEYSITVKRGVRSSEIGYAPIEEDYTFSFRTRSMIPALPNLDDSGRYSKQIAPTLPSTPGITYQYKLSYNGGAWDNYTGELIDLLGEYRLQIIAINNSSGDVQQKIISFSVIGDVAPFAADVAITGVPDPNTVLNGSYTFVDENSDAQGQSQFRWLISSENDGNYQPISGATSETYTLMPEDANKYIKFEVTPVSQVEPYTGQPTLSEPFATHFEPVAKNIVMEGNPWTGVTLTASYEYYDESNDDEDGTTFKWHSATNKEGPYTEIALADQLTYTLEETDESKYIVFEVAPNNNGSGEKTKVFRSAPFVGAFPPTVTNLRIMGSANVGQSISVAYDFTDINKDLEKQSLFKWYIGGSVISERASIDVQGSYAGSNIICEVTPVSSKPP